VLDTKEKKWSEFIVKGQKPAPRSQHSSMALGDNYLLILGGYTGGSLLDDVWCLDLKEATWKRLIIRSSDKGPRGYAGLESEKFRVRPATHTSTLLNWDSKVASILVLGLCSTEAYILTVRPNLGVMDWKPFKTTFKAFPIAHTYSAFQSKEGTIVNLFGGRMNEKDEPGTGGKSSYLLSLQITS